MSKVTQYKLLNLLVEVRRLEKLIKLHEPANNSFMVDQYQARKTEVTKEIIELILPVSNTDSFLFIRQFLDKYYSKKHYSNPAPAKKNTNVILDFELLQKEMVR